MKLKWFRAKTALTTVFSRVFSSILQIRIFWRKITFSGFLPYLFDEKIAGNLFLRLFGQIRQFRNHFWNSCFIPHSAQLQLGLAAQIENQISKSGEKSMRNLSRVRLSPIQFTKIYQVFSTKTKVKCVKSKTTIIDNELKLIYLMNNFWTSKFRPFLC